MKAVGETITALDQVNSYQVLTKSSYDSQMETQIALSVVARLVTRLLRIHRGTQTGLRIYGTRTTTKIEY